MSMIDPANAFAFLFLAGFAVLFFVVLWHRLRTPERVAPPAYSGLPVETIARIAHEANRQWCIHLGDHSQTAWIDAPLWQRRSAINGVVILLDHPDAGAKGAHENWMAGKLAAGWVHGKFKNPDAKPPTHPCIVPFEKLSKEQRFKDHLFNAIVDASRG